MNLLRDLIPARYRKIVYTILATGMSTELALDMVGWGIVPSDMQSKVVIVAGALGFTLAAGNTNRF